MTNHLSKLLSRFRSENKGGVALMAGLTIGLISAGVIASVDITDMRATKEKMQARLDSAVLFTTLQEELRDPEKANELQAIGRKFILDAVANGGINAEDITTSFVYDPVADKVVGQVTFTSPAIFAGSLLEPRGMTVNAEATPRAPTNMEFSLVLDMSGSMNWSVSNDIEEDAAVGSRRIDALREGVDALVETIEDNSLIRPKYSIVPYSTSVDLTDVFDDAGGTNSATYVGINGTAKPTVCSGGRQFSAQCLIDAGLTGRGVPNPMPPGAWGGEIYSAKNGDSFTITLDPPSASNPIPLVTQGVRGKSCHADHITRYGDECLDNVTIGPDTYLERDFFAPRIGPMGQTDDAEQVETYMSQLEAEGATAGHIGAAWGLYALTPEWSTVFNHSGSGPAAFDGESQKILIIMTDGQFNQPHDASITDAEVYSYFQAVCSLARSKGVTIYTVGLRSSTQTDAELTACAGNVQNYFPVDDRDSLIGSFEEIAAKEARVRLSL